MTSRNKKSKPINNTVFLTALSGLACELQAPLKLTTLRAHQLVETFKKKDFEYISYKDFKQLLQTIEQISRQLKHCCGVTDRMMHLHQTKREVAPQYTDINAVIKSILGLYKQQLQDKHIKSHLTLAKALPNVVISTVEIHQVIQHVLLNAIQAMPSGGALFIKTGLFDQDKFLLIEVRDQGVGINPEHLPKVFDPFFTTKERGVDKSAGLGLSVVYSIVNSLGGSINIKSSLRKGTRVLITLPVVK